MNDTSITVYSWTITDNLTIEGRLAVVDSSTLTTTFGPSPSVLTASDRLTITDGAAPAAPYIRVGPRLLPRR
jgi:hypothetical protein